MLDAVSELRERTDEAVYRVTSDAEQSRRSYVSDAPMPVQSAASETNEARNRLREKIEKAKREARQDPY